MHWGQKCFYVNCACRIEGSGALEGKNDFFFQCNQSKVWQQWGKGGREVMGWENCDSNRNHEVLIIGKICNMPPQDITTKNAHIHQ